GLCNLPTPHCPTSPASLYKTEPTVSSNKKQRRYPFGPWRVTFTQHLFSNGPRRLAFTPPASPTELNWVLLNTKHVLKVSIKHTVQRPTTEEWQLFQQAVLLWRPLTTTEDASALHPAAALAAVRSTVGRSSLTIQDSGHWWSSFFFGKQPGMTPLTEEAQQKAGVTGVVTNGQITCVAREMVMQRQVSESSDAGSPTSS
uniref:Uncharacterized protein n=1 Tax=Amphiprion ocellaris TaxID=80972 RepID=A0AAQ6ADU4_AMPOC